MIGLKAKSENKNDLGYDINLLHPLKLMPEAVLTPSLCLHVQSFPSSWHVVQDAHLTNVCIWHCETDWLFANISRVAVWIPVCSVLTII